MSFNETHNREIINETADTFKLNPITDLMPKSVVPNIQPVYDVNNRVMTTRAGVLTNATSSTIFTTNSDTTKSFYLKGLTFSFIKDASATTTFLGVQATLGGVVNTILSFPSLTTTAHSGSNSITFDGKGIRLDPNSNVTIVSTTNVGNFVARAELYGYIE